MIVDANVLLYAVDRRSTFHEQARGWLEDALNGSRRVGLPWQSIAAFLRIATNARATASPLQPQDAWEVVDAWLAAPATWIPAPGAGYGEIFRRLVVSAALRGNLVADAALAALALEHGVALVSADSDFARFRELDWVNPLTA